MNEPDETLLLVGVIASLPSLREPVLEDVLL